MEKYIVPSFIADEFTIMDLGYEKDARKPPIGPKTRYHYIIHVIISGKVAFGSNPSKPETVLHGGQIYAIYPNDVSLFKPLPDEPVEQYFLGFDAKNDEIVRYLGLTKNNPVQNFTDFKRISRAFDNLIDCWLNSNKDKFLFLMYFYNLLQALKPQNSVVDTEKSNFKDVFAYAIRYMEDNLYRNMTINELTDYLKIDRSYFSKIFKKQFMYSPYQYYLRIKLLKAQTMITSTDLTVTEISEKFGFCDIAAFSQAFFRQFKMRPNEYRQSIRRTDNNVNAKISDIVPPIKS